MSRACKYLLLQLLFPYCNDQDFLKMLNINVAGWGSLSVSPGIVEIPSNVPLTKRLLYLQGGLANRPMPCVILKAKDNFDSMGDTSCTHLYSFLKTLR